MRISQSEPAERKVYKRGECISWWGHYQSRHVCDRLKRDILEAKFARDTRATATDRPVIWILRGFRPGEHRAISLRHKYIRQCAGQKLKHTWMRVGPSRKPSYSESSVISSGSQRNIGRSSGSNRTAPDSYLVRKLRIEDVRVGSGW